MNYSIVLFLCAFIPQLGSAHAVRSARVNCAQFFATDVQFKEGLSFGQLVRQHGFELGTIAHEYISAPQDGRFFVVEVSDLEKILIAVGPSEIGYSLVVTSMNQGHVARIPAELVGAASGRLNALITSRAPLARAQERLQHLDLSFYQLDYGPDQQPLLALLVRELRGLGR